jgi:hypothetical protein
MSQLTHTGVPLSAQIKSHRLLALAGLMALVVTTAVVLVLAIGDSPSITSTADRSQPAVRADGGPEETGVAAAIASQPAVAAPDESKIAAAIGSGREAASASTRPDESAVATAIGSGREAASTSIRPDESAVAAAIGSGREAASTSTRPDESAVAAAVSGH